MGIDQTIAASAEGYLRREARRLGAGARYYGAAAKELERAGHFVEDRLAIQQASGKAALLERRSIHLGNAVARLQAGIPLAEVKDYLRQSLDKGPEVRAAIQALPSFVGKVMAIV